MRLQVPATKAALAARLSQGPAYGAAVRPPMVAAEAAEAAAITQCTLARARAWYSAAAAPAAPRAALGSIFAPTL